jgi:transposase
VRATVTRVKAKVDGASTPHRPLSWSQETAQRMTQRERPNATWINVLSQAQRLCSSLWRSAERDEVFASWGPEGRQKAIQYLRPLYKTTGNLLERLDAIEVSKRE